ncbi:MAG: signal transduction histidine kinase-like protein [Elusimicrobia bacterium]|nr:MAG: signal transduction histidine kinase-like protein [Elusimicrobiota bacterium]
METCPWVVNPHHAAARSRRPRILAADDDPDMRHILLAWLSPRHEIHVLADGEALLDAATEELPDLAIVDVHMPGADGWRVLSELRLRAGPRRMRVLILSGSVDDLEFLAHEDSGADGFLMKPVTRETLLRHVDSLLS